MRYLPALAVVIGLFAFLQRPAPQLHLALVDRGGARQELGTVPGATFAPRISASGKQVTMDTEDGSPAVWIADFPSLKSMRRLPGFAQYSMWSADGAELYFNRGNRLFSIPIKAAPTVTAGGPAAMPISGFIQDSGRRQFDITADGKQFLMLFP